MAERSIIWFRRDLRRSDHAAFNEAVADGAETVAAFVVDPRLWGPAGENRRAFLVGCLRALEHDLGGRLVVRHGDPAAEVPALADETGAERVWVSEDFAPYGRHRDEQVAAALAARGRTLRAADTPYAIAPGTLHTKSGSPYRVFTAFWKAWRDHGAARPVRRTPAPAGFLHDVRSDGIPDPPRVETALPAPGEAAARRRLDAFLRSRAGDYHRRRDRPDLEGTSRLSPYLKWGCLHPRTLLGRLDLRVPGHLAFCRELCWRDFYADVLFHDPDSARRGWREAMRGLRVDGGKRADARLERWRQGHTGYPIVDAGMRQLLGEGWMHNRVRMIVASFLVKDLHLDWSAGARHFLTHLVDGDLASNQHNWQWVAGTGTDAQPFFRVFNPVTQSKRFDPAGDYIRRFVPELADLGADEIHDPWRRAGGPPNGYPEPVVDHRVEREEALARYAALRRD